LPSVSVDVAALASVPVLIRIATPGSGMPLLVALPSSRHIPAGIA
jgi:hypothetical protein